MKMFCLSFALLASAPVYAQESNPSHMLQLPPGMEQQAVQPVQEASPAQAAAPMLPAITDNAQLDESLRMLQHGWAHIKYQVNNEKDQETQIEKLAADAAKVSAQYPAYAEPKIWQAIILSTQAGIKGGLGAIGLAKDAKKLLEQAQKINAEALDGSVYTSLGSLYYKVPGWPIGFGDDKKALAYLEQARALNPDGIDPNYFYGDYLIEQGKYAEAVPVLEHALQAPARVGREDADSGRRAEIEKAIQQAKSHL